MSSMKISFFSTLVAAAALALVGCGPTGDSAAKTEGSSGGTSTLTGSISIDGSSTVSPVSEAMAEEFSAKNSGVRPTVATSGTGGGFKKFAAGEIDIAGASRPIETSEIDLAKTNGVEFVEIPVAFDGLSVVVNPANDFAEDLTVEELKKIWEPNSKVKTWADVRAGFPAEPIKLYGAGTDSGTFDYFTKAINGEEKASRTDYQASEDDNTLVQGVAGDKYALGYFGYAYYEQNKDKLKLVKVNGIAPSPETIADGTYTPLSRPLFWYVNTKALDRAEVKALLDFLFENAETIIPDVGYVPLPAEAYAATKAIVDEKKTGTRFQGAEIGLKIEEILNRESK